MRCHGPQGEPPARRPRSRARQRASDEEGSWSQRRPLDRHLADTAHAMPSPRDSAASEEARTQPAERKAPPQPQAAGNAFGALADEGEGETGEERERENEKSETRRAGKKESQVHPCQPTRSPLIRSRDSRTAKNLSDF